jgi:hypothetical protein
MIRVLFLLACVSVPCEVGAQQPVKPWADWSSYGTAVGNPGSAVLAAWRSPARYCYLVQFGVSEALGQGGRRWFGGSGHAMNSVIGSSGARWGTLKGRNRWLVSLGLVVATMLLRQHDNQDTFEHVAAGALIGGAAETVGHIIGCQ